ncbi:putative integral membrane protein (TIGR02327 family) [Salsuginibacillus halophilus]|uniref:Putative integral membrane protein (TIGR02327 family) n=1 Tax=Salsuginibacillus halophilus TaxID=517424 RepID=A0A2P8HHV4_9BACI|nr:DUF1146 family protein [Salsuginibacillus halophilus]PSL45771.1 putative integral membrane protein (TIGR02327 family) [Salsuginibacillus halophilus]
MMVGEVGQQAVVHIFVTLFVLVLVWWSLQSFKFELFVRDPASPQGRVLYVLVVVALTYAVSQFLLDYVNWSLMLQYLF